jgi:hypothetical protein
MTTNLRVPARSCSSTRRVHVVVTCANRKTRPVPAGLRIRELARTDVVQRADQWIQRLTSAPADTVPARSLYAGEHWDVARRLPQHTRPDVQVVLWVCSAGYGLIPAEAPIRPYSATLTPGQPDTVAGDRKARAAWWAALANWEGPTGGPRSVTHLAASDPTARMLLVLSAAYLAACHRDVITAAGKLSTPDTLSIISAGTKPEPELAEVLLPSDARLQHTLGGTRQSLNVRIADHLLSQGLSSHRDMRSHLTELLAVQPPIPTFSRQPLSDGQVRAFIRARLSAKPNASRTGLLFELRDSGHACEQARFASLFRAEVELIP